MDAEISTEESVRDASDASLTTRVSSEEVARSTADDSIVTYLDAADASLTSRVSTEESVRLSADNSLAAQISDITAADFNRVDATLSDTIVLFNNSLVVGTEFIYLNGLLQSPDIDYVVETSDTNGNTLSIKFNYDPEGGRVQAAGQVVA